MYNIHSGVTEAECSSEEEAQRVCDAKNRRLFRSNYNYERMPDRLKTPYEQRWDAMSDLQKMQLQGLLEHYSNEYIRTITDGFGVGS